MRILIFLLLFSYLANAQVCEPVGFSVEFIKTPNDNSLCDYKISVAWDNWGDGETFVIENTDISCSNQVPVSDGEVELICEADCNEEVCFIYSVLNANNEICFQKTECLSPPLPIELKSFKGIPTKEGNLIEIVTATEDNVNYISLERSNDLNTLEEFIRFPANNKPSTYEYLDKEVLETAYYRLKAVDLDGSFQYSHIIAVKNIFEYFIVFPNPFDRWLEITEDAEMFDIYRNEKYFLQKGINDTSNLKEGTYFVNNKIIIKQ